MTTDQAEHPRTDHEMLVHVRDNLYQHLKGCRELQGELPLGAALSEVLEHEIAWLDRLYLEVATHLIEAETRDRQELRAAAVTSPPTTPWS